mmetsp:Transcript_35507/g.106167  ORF Transcript_35507/g.106167 Transcript_35507/m.106167 type:complete len:267 (-) Transcript_35507:416-1216(-)
MPHMHMHNHMHLHAHAHDMFALPLSPIFPRTPSHTSTGLLPDRKRSNRKNATGDRHAGRVRAGRRHRLQWVRAAGEGVAGPVLRDAFGARSCCPRGCCCTLVSRTTSRVAARSARGGRQGKVGTACCCPLQRRLSVGPATVPAAPRLARRQHGRHQGLRTRRRSPRPSRRGAAIPTGRGAAGGSDGSRRTRQIRRRPRPTKQGGRRQWPPAPLAPVAASHRAGSAAARQAEAAAPWAATVVSPHWLPAWPPPPAASTGRTRRRARS